MRLLNPQDDLRFVDTRMSSFLGLGIVPRHLHIRTKRLIYRGVLSGKSKKYITANFLSLHSANLEVARRLVGGDNDAGC